ncbi:OPT family oligopeptide transporter [Pirellulaceae bacterium SH449]
MADTTKNDFQPFIPEDSNVPEFTWGPLVMGSLLGIIFGASSMYLVIKVGLTVSASIPVAVLALTFFRILSRLTGGRKSTILEHNIVQTAGSAGESLAFAVGMIMPALLLLGFEIDVVRVMTISVFGGLLGILLMIPLRQAFMVKQHGKLIFPEGKACAEVLVAGEKGGGNAIMIFAGFALSFAYQLLMGGLKLWSDAVSLALHTVNAAGKAVGLKGASLGLEASPTLLGVGYIIGPKISSIMVAGGVLAYLVIAPMIVYFGEGLAQPLEPATMLISDMDDDDIRNNYILYIGAGAVAAGGIISMIQAMPVILAALFSSLRDLNRAKVAGTTGLRTEKDIPLPIVFGGSIVLVLSLMAVPQLGLGFGFTGFVAALMIMVFAFLFVTVAARITGEIGSTSSPISGMTVATLLLTCLILLLLDSFGLVTINKEIKLTALTVAGVVCIACSNGGSTAQALKVGHLVGATPRSQQIAILIGALTCAFFVGLVLLAMNEANTTYSKNAVSPYASVVVDTDGLPKGRVNSGPYSDDTNDYSVLILGRAETDRELPPGKYLIDADGKPVYLVDPAINGVLKSDDAGNPTTRYEAPKTVLMQLIIDGILDRRLPWGLVMLGVLIAVTLELSGVASLPFAVGVYLPLSASTPIFVGGMVRYLADKWKGRSQGEDDSSPAVLLSSGYIAGGAIAAVLISLMNFSPAITQWFEARGSGLAGYLPNKDILAFGTFLILTLCLAIVGAWKTKHDRSS